MVEIKLPIKRPRLIARDVSHVFVDSDQKKAVEELLNNGVLCLLPVYIGSFLIMVGDKVLSMLYIFFYLTDICEEGRIF